MVEAKVGRVFVNNRLWAQGLKVTQAELEIRIPITMAYMAEGPASTDHHPTICPTQNPKNPDRIIFLVPTG